MDNSASAPPLPNINLEGINNIFPNLRAPLKLGMQTVSVLLIKVEEHIFSCFGAGRPLLRRGLVIGGRGYADDEFCTPMVCFAQPASKDADSSAELVRAAT